MPKQKQANRLTKKKKVLIYVLSALLALALLGSFIYWDARESQKANLKVATKKAAETLVNTPKSAAEDPGKIKQFEISIPKIGVTAQVVPNVDGSSKEAYNLALKNGVAHFMGTGLPSAGSNIFIFGHSSSIYGTGKYDKIFAKLNNLTNGDVITLNFNNKAYGYKVVKKKIISAADTSVTAPTDTEQLTLMTCWPVGTNQKRLIVIAKPI